MNKQEKYVYEIMSAVQGLFDEEAETFKYDINDVDGTKFFTAYVQAGAMLFNQFTGNSKNGLEFSYLANQLIVQDMLDK